MIRYGRKPSPRTEYRLRRTEQINNSPTLSEKFPQLKTLRVTVEYFDSSGTTMNGAMKHKLNVEHSKSLLFFNCVNSDCVGGDYDLSEALAEAINARRKVAVGEVRCQGTRCKNDQQERRSCQSILRYKLTLGY